MSFSSLRDILPETLEHLGIAARVQEARALRAWPAVAQAVSDALSARSRPLRLREGVLVVHVPDQALAQLARQRHDELIQALAGRLGAGVVRQLQITGPP